MLSLFSHQSVTNFCLEAEQREQLRERYARAGFLEIVLVGPSLRRAIPQSNSFDGGERTLWHKTGGLNAREGAVRYQF
jgi:hypothetical protein